MRLKLTLNDGNGYDSEQEFVADPEAGCLYDPDDSPLKASERMDLGEVAAAFNESAMNDAGEAVDALEALEDDLHQALDKWPIKKATIKDWAIRIDAIIATLRESVGQIDAEGRKVGVILEVVQ